MPFSSCGFLWIVPQQSDRCTPQVERRQQLLADCPIRQQNPLAGCPNTSACITMSESRRAAPPKARQPSCHLHTGISLTVFFFFFLNRTYIQQQKKDEDLFCQHCFSFSAEQLHLVLHLIFSCAVSYLLILCVSHFTLKGPLSGSFSGAYFKLSRLPDNPSCSRDALVFHNASQ